MKYIGFWGNLSHSKYVYMHSYGSSLEWTFQLHGLSTVTTSAAGSTLTVVSCRVNLRYCVFGMGNCGVSHLYPSHKSRLCICVCG